MIRVLLFEKIQKKNGIFLVLSLFIKIFFSKKKICCKNLKIYPKVF